MSEEKNKFFKRFFKIILEIPKIFFFNFEVKKLFSQKQRQSPQKVFSFLSLLQKEEKLTRSFVQKIHPFTLGCRRFFKLCLKGVDKSYEMKVLTLIFIF